jgi:hypothetical protein
MENRDKWVIEVGVNAIRGALTNRINNLTDLVKEIDPDSNTDTRLQYRREGYLGKIKHYSDWRVFVTNMEPERKLFLTFEDYEFFFTDR